LPPAHPVDESEIVEALAGGEVVDGRGDDVAAGEPEFAVMDDHVALDADAGEGVGVEVSGGVVLPLQAASEGVEGVHVGAVVVDDAGGDEGDAVLDEDTAGGGPGGEQLAVDGDLRSTGAARKRQRSSAVVAAKA
jgi:hypothetical protein